MNFSQLRTDKKLEVKGKWFNFDKTTRFLIARHRNPEYRELMRELMDPHQHKLATGLMEDDIADDIFCEVLSKTVLLGWEGLEDTDENGNVFLIEYSHETAKNLLLESEDFRAYILSIASRADNFKLAQLKEVVEEAKK